MKCCGKGLDFAGHLVLEMQAVEEIASSSCLPAHSAGSTGRLGCERLSAADIAEEHQC